MEERVDGVPSKRGVLVLLEARSGWMRMRVDAGVPLEAMALAEMPAEVRDREAFLATLERLGQRLSLALPSTGPRPEGLVDRPRVRP
jgi:hypothetical protein